MSADISPAMRVDLYSHGMRVTGFKEPGERALLAFCRNLAQFDSVRAGGRYVQKMVRIFGGRTADKQEIYLHRHLEDDLRRHLASHGLMGDAVQWNEQPLFEPVRCEFKSNPADKRLPFDYQPTYIDYLASPGHSKVVTIQTGRGKTFCMLKAVQKMGVRTMLVLKGMYVEKWIEDVQKAFDFQPEDLMVVRGSTHFAKLIELGLAGQLNCKFIICTNKTLFDFYKSYEKFKDTDVGYRIHPLELYQTLGVGLRVIDEVHQDFHLNFRQDIYAHIPKTCSLSATLRTRDPFISRMYDIVFPSKYRPPPLEFKKYIAMKGLVYSIKNPRLIRCKNGKRQYSHVMFEQSIMKYPQVLNSYMQMVLQIVRHSFLRVREPGQRCLVYFATVEMCTLFQKLLKMHYGDLQINRYTAEEDYEALLSADIACTTLQSAGTAVDIPGLRTVVMTTALSSMQANEQALGRLRELTGDWAGVTPEFLFLICREIDKHMHYAQSKHEDLADKVLSYNLYHTNFHVG